MSRPRRVLGYARVSSAEQALGTSLRDQQAAIARYAQERGLEVTRFFVEAESAVHDKYERREQMQALMREVREGDLVVCDKIDRWSRDPEFTYGSVRKILAMSASWYAVADRCDPSTNEGDSALGFRILFAREEHKRIRERTVGTRNILRDQGYYVEGQPPFGYRRAKPKGYKGVDKNVLVPDGERAELVKRAFRMCVAGKALTEISTTLAIAKKTVYYILHNRHYLGELRNSRHEWMKGSHEPLISADLFARAQDALADRKYATRVDGVRTGTWFLRDLARCGLCGGKMSAAYGRTQVYYRCRARCTRAHVRVDLVETQVAKMIVERLVELREELAKGPEPTKVPTTDFAGRRAKLERKRDRYLEAHADELMTREELRRKLEALDAERLKLDAEEASVTKPALADAGTRRDMLRELKTLQKAWRCAPPLIRREIARRLMSDVRMVVNELPSPTWRPLEVLAASIGA